MDNRIIPTETKRTEITVLSSQDNLKLYRFDSLDIDGRSRAIRLLTPYYQNNYRASLFDLLDADRDYYSEFLTENYGLSFARNEIEIDLDHSWMSVKFEVSQDFYDKIIDEEIKDDETKRGYLKEGIDFFKDCYDHFYKITCTRSRGSLSKIETAYNDLMSEYSYRMINDFISSILDNDDNSHLSDDERHQKAHDMLNQIEVARLCIFSKLERAVDFIYTSLDDANAYEESEQAVSDWLEGSYCTYLFNEKGVPLAVINIEIDKNSFCRDSDTVSMIMLDFGTIRIHSMKFKIDEKNI